MKGPTANAQDKVAISKTAPVRTARTVKADVSKTRPAVQARDAKGHTGSKKSDPKHEHVDVPGVSGTARKTRAKKAAPRGTKKRSKWLTDRGVIIMLGFGYLFGFLYIVNHHLAIGSFIGAVAMALVLLAAGEE